MSGATCGVILALVSLATPGPSQGAPATSDPLQRRYQAGEKSTYHMTASNEDIHRKIRYEADATVTVTKDPAGIFVEDFEWTSLVVNRQAVSIPTGKEAVHQRLSRDPAFKLTIPDMSKVPPALVGPIADLLTFYADLQLAGREGKLQRAGDHFYFKHGAPASWADGATILVGEDSVDFDVSLTEVDRSRQTATLVVRHLPPETPQIRKLAEWTAIPAGDTKNNWVQVIKLGPEDYLGQVGKETFDVRLTTSLGDGRLLSATLDNLVEVIERPSKNADLSAPGAETRYSILRKIEMHESSAAPIAVQYDAVRPEHQASLSKEPCALAANLKTKENQVVVSAFGNWSATVLETDPVAVPYEQARACILLSGPDGAARSVTVGGFRTLRLTWVNERLLYLFTDVGHVASVGQLLDVDDMKWLYARTEYYPN